MFNKVEAIYVGLFISHMACRMVKNEFRRISRVFTAGSPGKRSKTQIAFIYMQDVDIVSRFLSTCQRQHFVARSVCIMEPITAVFVLLKRKKTKSTILRPFKTD